MIFCEIIGSGAVHTAKSQSKSQQSPENKSLQDFFFPRKSCKI
jgi:hypothetical protein